MELLLEPQPGIDRDVEFAALPEWLKKAIKLYNRCRMFNEIALPCPGGVLDQDELTCCILERIHWKHNAIMNQRMEARVRRVQQKDGKSIDSVNVGHKYSRRSKL